MLKKTLCALGLLIPLLAFADTIEVSENSNVSLDLSYSNYSRLFIKDDTILDFIFVKDSLEMEKGEDGDSVYVVPALTTACTVFISTEKGRHFSLTLSPAENSLGKTVEFVFKDSKPKALVSSPAKKPAALTPKVAANKVPEVIAAFLSHMEEGKSFSDVKIHNSFGKVERWQKGLSLLPKALWTSEKLHGEIIEVYNGGSTPITLSESWFAKQGSLAIKLKTPTLKAHEKTTLYRISEVSHG